MRVGILEAARQAAERIGHCDPQWLRSGEEPQFEVVEGGDKGPPMLLLHGLFGALSNWDTVFPLMAGFTKPMALRFPLLTSHRSEVKVRSLAVYTEFFLRRRSLGPAVLCGNSMGGHVAMRVCLASPELVDCLILSGSSGLYEHSVDTLPVRPDKKFVRDHMSRVFYDPKFITDDAVDEIANILAHRQHVLNLIHAARSAKKDNLLQQLKNIKIPTLLLWGEDDLVTTMDVAETFHKNIPNSKLVTIKGCGHAPMIEHPEWFANEVKTFLKDIGKLNS